MKKYENKNYLIYFVYVLAFAFMFGIMLCCPRINDDYSFLDYGINNLKDAVHFSLYYGNGRFLGNITSVLMIGNKTLFAAEKAIILFIVIALLPKTVRFGDNKNSDLIMFISSYSLVMGMAPYIFREVITWSTCFQNYVPPVAGLIICSYLIKSKSRNPLAAVLIFIVGFASQLFLELNTVVNGAFSFVILVLCFLKYKDRLVKALMFFISSGLGALTMFAIPKIFVDPKRQNHMGIYRGFHVGSFSDLKSTVINNTIKLTVPMRMCIVLLIILSVLMCIVVNASKMKKSYKFISKMCVLLLPAFHIIFQVYLDNRKYVDTVYYRLLCLVLLALFGLGVFLCIISMENCTEKLIAVISAFFVIISILPVTIVSPVLSRCAYLYYMFLVTITLVTLSYLLKRKRLPAGYNIAVVICAFVLTLNLGISYYNIKVEAAKQTASIEAQMKNHADVVKVKVIDNPYMHRTSKKMFQFYYYNEKHHDVTFEYVN